MRNDDFTLKQFFVKLRSFVADAHYDFTEKCFLFECVYRFTVDVELKNVFISSALFISQKVSQLTKNHILGIFA